MNFWRETLNSSERRQPLEDPQQIAFINLIWFWSLSKKTFISLFLTDNIQACFTLCFKFWEGTSLKMQLPVLYFLFCISFYIQISSFYDILELHSTLSEKYFCHKFFFFNEFSQTSHPLNSQNLWSVRKLFWPIFSKMPSEIFLKKN